MHIICIYLQEALLGINKLSSFILTNELKHFRYVYLVQMDWNEEMQLL